MKRFWLGLGILLSLTVLGIVATVGSQRICSPISKDLLLASQTALDGDWGRAEAFAEAAGKRWNTYRNLTASVINHEPMEEIEALFHSLQVYSQQKDALCFADCCRRLSSLTSAIGESQVLQWWNVL